MSETSNLADNSAQPERSGCMKWLLVAMVILLVAFFWRKIFQPDPGYEVNTSENRDMLSYLSNEGQLILYDPLTRRQTVLLEGVSSYVLSWDGRVAFTRLDERYSDVYVYDPATPSVEPINISQEPTKNHRPLAWHPNGQYLAYASFFYLNDAPRRGSMNDIDHTLLIWDGETTQDAMLEDGQPAFSIDSRWIWDDVPPRIEWHIDSDEIPEASSYWEGSYELGEEPYLVGLTGATQVHFYFTLASGLPSSHLVARNTDEDTLFRAHVGNFAWSGDGYLAFCRVSATGWTLSLWNGRRSWAVARTRYQPIQWQHGDTTFSCNNG